MVRFFVFGLLFMCSVYTGSAQKWKEAWSGNFSIQYPEGWDMVLGPDEFDSSLFTIYSPAASDNDIFRQNVGVAKVRAAPIPDLKKETDNTIAYLGQNLPEFKLDKEPKLGRGDFKTAFTLQYSALDNGERWTTYACVISENTTIYHLIFLSPSDEFDQYAEMVEKIFASFKRRK